jgi:hypothetical protein
LADDDIFIGGFDSAHGGMKQSRGTRADDSALATWRIPGGTGIPQLVHLFRKSGLSTARPLSAMLHKLDMRFAYTYIVADPGGGTLWIKDELARSQQELGGEKFHVTPILTFDPQATGVGIPKLIEFNRGDTMIRAHFSTLAGESTLVNLAHTYFKNAIDNHEVAFPEEWREWSETIGRRDVRGMRMWLNRHGHGLKAIDLVAAEIDLALTQLLHIGLKKDTMGIPQQSDLGMFKFVSGEKKDAAMAILYGFFGCVLWKRINVDMSDGGKHSVCGTVLVDKNV